MEVDLEELLARHLGLGAGRPVGLPGADPLSLLAWLRREDPAAYDRIDRLLFCKDVIRHRLTGRACTDEMEASVFENRDDERAVEAFERLGIADRLDAVQEAVPSAATAGTVTAAAADQTGLSEGTPVAAGLHDVGACALGAGTMASGQGLLIVGTWGQSIAVADDPSPPDEPGISRRYFDRWLTYRGTRSATACIDWFASQCCADWREATVERGIDEYTLYDELISDIDLGADGVVFHPFLRGSTDDPNARGGFYGLGADHTSAHMLRAIYEGVAVDLGGALDRLEPDCGFADVRIAGGGARSHVWTGMFADVLGQRVVVPDAAEIGALGAAICGGVAAGVYPDVGAAADATVAVERVHEPDRQRRYSRVRERFDLVREALEPFWESLDGDDGFDGETTVDE